MQEVKVGDKVRVIANTSCHSLRIGEITEIVKIYELRYYYFCPEYLNRLYMNIQDFELINSNNNNMENLKEKFITAFLKEPEKSFRKAGITNGDGILTDDGEKIFLGWLLSKKGKEFKEEVVDEILDEVKKDKE